MVKKLLTGNSAAAWGARLARIDYVPAFPITPQTEIIESLAGWIERGQMAARYVMVDSEHSMLTAAGAAAATGVRVFTATSSQGLLYALEALYTIAGWRVPLVLVNVSRALSSPITLGPDHNDLLAARDAGVIQLHAATCQEVLDSILIGYRLAEDPRISLPVLVNLDGFQLSFTREPVEIPDPAQADEFLPPFEPRQPGFRASQPVAHGVAVLDPAAYTYFRSQQHLAMNQAVAVHGEIADQFARQFGRQYSAVEPYFADDADWLLVMMGSSAALGQAAVDRWRAAGQRVGLLRLRMIRPWPAAELRRWLAGRSGVAVIDQSLAPGAGGILFNEVAAAVAGWTGSPRVLRSFVGGLGGKEFSISEFEVVRQTIERALANAAGSPPPPAQLLLTHSELTRIQQALDLAGKHPDQEISHESTP